MILASLFRAVIQFGYVTIFAGVFPLVGALAFVRNLVELRADAFRLCHIYRRPVGEYCFLFLSQIIA